MKELMAGVGIMAMCLIGSMESGRAPVSTYDTTVHMDSDCVDTTTTSNVAVSNDEEARRVCGAACGALGGEWNGTWQTSIGGTMTFCGCRICTAAQ